jgi:ATP-binding cassette subfamily F protein 3
MREYNALAKKIPSLEEEWLELSTRIEEGADA